MKSMTEQSCIHCKAEKSFMFPCLSVLLDETTLEYEGVSMLAIREAGKCNAANYINSRPFVQAWRAFCCEFPAILLPKEQKLRLQGEDGAPA